jgi:hypothetical protein
VALVVLLAALAVLLVRLTASPDLGGAPAGPDDGQSPLEIAATLAGSAGIQLAQPGATGAVVVVSEQDLSILAAAVNPDPGSFTDLQVRARTGQLWITASSRLGPLAVVVTARLGLGFAPGRPITTDLEEIDVGDQAIPGFLRSAVDPRGSAAFSLTPLLSGSQLSQYGLECVVVVPYRGLELGFHEPSASPSPGYCAAHPPPAAVAGATTPDPVPAGPASAG